MAGVVLLKGETKMINSSTEDFILSDEYKLNNTFELLIEHAKYAFHHHKHLIYMFMYT